MHFMLIQTWLAYKPL